MYVIYLDQSSAFDKCSINGIISGMNNLGITGKTGKYIADWLSGRYQKVQVGDSFSESRAVTSGVPQGSRLAPYQFALYVAPMVTGLKSMIKQYADDVTLMAYADNEEDLQALQEDLDRITAWSQQQGLHFNPMKSTIIKYGNGHIVRDFQIGGSIIPQSQETKDLDRKSTRLNSSHSSVSRMPSSA